MLIKTKNFDDGLISLAVATTPSTATATPVSSDRLRVTVGPGPGRVNRTVGNRSGLTGNRSNRSGPVSVSIGTQPVKI